MILMVPTVWAEAMTKREMRLGDTTYKIGELVKVPYGVALQGLATGTFSCLRDEANLHMEALEHLQVYGPDSWFPAQMQTIAKLWNYVQKERADDEPEVPRNENGETIQ